tara:strand:+ start:7404 stop:8798 length:1395 start_codon:yes stop_codon:yes gene_type:complete
MEISSFIRSHKGQNLFLPAHSRGIGLPKELRKLLRGRPGIWDLPELPGLGGPLFSSGAVHESQKYSACSFGVDKCWYGVNGATGLLQAAILSLATPGSGILMPRNVHKSVIQACSLGDITPYLFDLPFLPDRGHYLPPDHFWMNKVLENIPSDGPQVAGVLLVNPSYQGYSSDIGDLVYQCHSKGLPVIVDEAHGAHFTADLEELPKSAIKAGADLVVHSLHKSANGLVQTAVLWMQGNQIDPTSIERSLALLQTTSPSSLLLSSCELALRELKSLKGKQKLKSIVYEAKEIFNKLLAKDIPLIKIDDPLRLVFHTDSYGISGFQADEWMMSHNIYAELPEPACLTFCLGLAPHKGLAKKLSNNWSKLIKFYGNKKSSSRYIAPPVDLIMTPEMSCFSASKKKNKLINLKDCAGEISADIICPYPPGTPFVIPGQLMKETYVLWLLTQKVLWPNLIDSKIRVVA